MRTATAAPPIPSGGRISWISRATSRSTLWVSAVASVTAATEARIRSANRMKDQMPDGSSLDGSPQLLGECDHKPLRLDGVHRDEALENLELRDREVLGHVIGNDGADL